MRLLILTEPIRCLRWISVSQENWTVDTTVEDVGLNNVVSLEDNAVVRAPLLLDRSANKQASERKEDKTDAALLFAALVLAEIFILARNR